MRPKSAAVRARRATIRNMQDASSSRHAEVVEDAVTRLRALYGERFLGLFDLPRPLFGDDDESPDLQFIALLSGTIDAYVEIERISEHTSDLSLAHSLYVSIYPIGERDLEYRSTCIPMGLRRGDMHRVA